MKAGYSSQREQELDAAKYKDVCAALTEEYVDSCLVNSFTALLGGECTTAPTLSSDPIVLASGFRLPLGPLKGHMVTPVGAISSTLAVLADRSQSSVRTIIC